MSCEAFSYDSNVGKCSRNQKISCLRIKIPRSSKKDGIQGLGLFSPTVAAEEELVKRRGRSGSSRSRSPTNSPSIYPANKSLEQISEKKKKLLEEGSKL